MLRLELAQKKKRDFVYVSLF